eukprot:434633_1
MNNLKPSKAVKKTSRQIKKDKKAMGLRHKQKKKETKKLKNKDKNNQLKMSKTTNITDINQSKFVLNWNHIITSMKTRLYPKIGKVLNDVIYDKKLGINFDDLSEKTVQLVLDEIGKRNNLSKEQIDFMNGLICKAKRFNPFKQDFVDDPGIIYWIGTDQGRNEWINPATNGKVKLLSSVSSKSKVKLLQSILNTKQISFCSENTKNSWIMIDLLNISVKPTHYLLTHYKLDE